MQRTHDALGFASFVWHAFAVTSRSPCDAYMRDLVLAVVSMKFCDFLSLHLCTSTVLLSHAVNCVFHAPVQSDICHAMSAMRVSFFCNINTEMLQLAPQWVMFEKKNTMRTVMRLVSSKFAESLGSDFFACR